MLPIVRLCKSWILYNNANKNRYTSFAFTTHTVLQNSTRKHPLSLTVCLTYTQKQWFTTAGLIHTGIGWAVLTSESLKVTGQPPFSVPHDTAAMNNKPSTLPSNRALSLSHTGLVHFSLIPRNHFYFPVTCEYSLKLARHPFNHTSCPLQFT